MRKYIKLFEEADHVQTQIDALKITKELGLIGDAEYFQLMYELDPSSSKKWSITFEVDWDWAAQNSSEETKNLLNQEDFFKSDDSSSIFLDKSSIYLEEWDEHDYWESSGEDEEELDDPKYGTRNFLRVTAYSAPTVTEREVEEWTHQYLGRVFSESEVTEESQ